MAHFVQFNDVTKTYRMGETSVDALSGMSFEIDEGELVVILGTVPPPSCQAPDTDN